MPRDYQDTYTTKDTVPPSTAFTPTVTTVGVYFRLSVAGSAAKRGAVLYVAAQNQTRRIAFMMNDLEGHLESAFGSNLTSATVRIVPQEEAKLVKWSAAPPTGGASFGYNGEAVPTNTTITREISDIEEINGANFLDIPVIDGTTNNPLVIWTLF